MAYEEPTVAEFQARFPKFQDTPDATIQAALDEAALFVDNSWPESFYKTAKMLYACHVLTLEGQGTGGESQMATAGLLMLKRIRSGELDVERFSAKDQGQDVTDWFTWTPCGTRFISLRGTAFPAILLV